jgi:vacuolar-type H+-ATPase subunit H
MKLHREAALREILASEDAIDEAINGSEKSRREAYYEARRQAEMDAAGRYMNSQQRRQLRKHLRADD